MEFKGTKGDWINTYPIITSEEEDICEIFVHLDAYMDNSNSIAEKTAEANAKLISCAPKMLEMLNRIEKSSLLYGSTIAYDLQELITKATTI